MTAAAVAPNASRRRPDGIRVIHPRRDMAAVADLIEVAFAGQLDASGRRMVRDMRTFGRAGWIGWLASRFLLPPAANPQGFVWEQDGRLIGNASLLPVQEHPERWVLANVAVHPEHQRRGIGRELVRASMRFARSAGAKTLLLQVQSANQGAQQLYARLGFQPLSTRTTWVRHTSYAAHTTSPELHHLRPRRTHEWRSQFDLASRLFPEGLLWPYPLRESFFRPTLLERWLGVGVSRHWVWHEAGRLQASVSVRGIFDRGAWQLVLLVEPARQGRIERELLAEILARNEFQYASVGLEYPAGLAQDALLNLGFQAEHSLTWMALSL